MAGIWVNGKRLNLPVVDGCIGNVQVLGDQVYVDGKPYYSGEDEADGTKEVSISVIGPCASVY